MPRKPPVHSPAGVSDRQQQRRTYDQTRDKQEWRGWYKTEVDPVSETGA